MFLPQAWLQNKEVTGAQFADAFDDTSGMRLKTTKKTQWGRDEQKEGDGDRIRANKRWDKIFYYEITITLSRIPNTVMITSKCTNCGLHDNTSLTKPRDDSTSMQQKSEKWCHSTWHLLMAFTRHGEAYITQWFPSPTRQTFTTSLTSSLFILFHRFTVKVYSRYTYSSNSD